MSKGFGLGPIPGMGQAGERELSPQSAHLVLRNGPQAGAEFSLTKLTTLLGRDDPPQVSVDIDLSALELSDTPVVSRRHAELTWRGAVLELTDLGSTNGTLVNGESLKGAAPREPSIARSLKPGDRLTFADLEFELITR